MMNSNKREGWVDIAKGIAITSVVFGHVGFEYPMWKLFPLSLLLAWLWHVPVFFLIGGFFIKEEKLVQPQSFIYGKYKNLYLKIVYLYIPVLLLHNYFVNIGFYDSTITYHGVYVTQWDIYMYIRKIVLALLFFGKEPVLDAMWFVYVLFLALCCLSIVSFAVKKIWRNDNNYRYALFFVLLLLVMISCILTKVYDITIFRVSCTFSAMWLIYIGMLIKQYKKVSFDNPKIAIISFLIAWGSAVMNGGVILVDNIYNDVLSLTITSCACLYVVCYISKRIYRNIIGKIFNEIGKESFTIMALHFIAFKILTLILNLCGIDVNLGQTNPYVGYSVILLVLYTIIGLFLPILFIKVIRSLLSTIRLS